MNPTEFAVSVQMTSAFYQHGLTSLLSQIPWLTLKNSIVGANIVFTDNSLLEADGQKVLVTDCCEKLTNNLLDQFNGILCTIEITRENLSECLTRLKQNAKYYSPLVQKFQLQLQFKRSIGEPHLRVVEMILAYPSRTVEQNARSLCISKTTFSSRVQDLHAIFNSSSKAELVIKVYQAGIA
ncbi:MAG: hypothetical protein AAF902_10655 [Chloroflexota bacterium]